MTISPTKQLGRAAFRYEFLNRSEFAIAEIDVFQLTYISRHDRSMSEPEFCEKVAASTYQSKTEAMAVVGAKILMSRLSALLLVHLLPHATRRYRSNWLSE
jgi:hypothetical protein